MRNIEGELAICEAATPGPWWTRGFDDTICIVRDGGEYVVPSFTLPSTRSIEQRIKDADCVCKSRTGYPAALRALAAIKQAATIMPEAGDTRYMCSVIERFECGEFDLMDKYTALRIRIVEDIHKTHPWIDFSSFLSGGKAQIDSWLGDCFAKLMRGSTHDEYSEYRKALFLD